MGGTIRSPTAGKSIIEPVTHEIFRAGSLIHLPEANVMAWLGFEWHGKSVGKVWKRIIQHQSYLQRGFLIVVA